MDPVTIVIIILLFVLGGGAAAGGRVAAVRRRRRAEIREAIRQRTEVAGGVEVSIFDVFWDLGVSEYALEIMGNQGFLIRDLGSLPIALDAIADAVKVHDSYSAFIRDNLETIQEFYNEHRKAGNRRALPSLEVRKTKTLELPAVGEDKSENVSQLPVPYAEGPSGGHLPIVARSFDERISARSGGSFAPLVTTVGGQAVDVDALTRVDILHAVFTGGVGQEIQRWFQMRGVRELRDELDLRLADFYTFYVEQVQRDARFYAHLHDVAKRWELEARRVDDLIERERWADRPWADCARELLGEAAAVSRQLSWLSRNNVDQTIEKIHDHARRGDMAMAGYLVYLNHNAFFAGRTGDYSEYVRGVENATYRLQEELRELDRKGVV